MKLLKNKEIQNAGWLIGGKIAQMLVSFVIGILTARYLGPANFGTINYATAFVTFFTSLCTLGINSVIIRDFIEHPEEEGEAIGSAIVMRAFSSFLSALMIVGIVSILDHDEPATVLVAVLCSVSLLFQIFDTINYWFQSRYQSKVTSLATLIAYIIVSLYKVLLLVLKKDVAWFAFSTSLDYICIAVFLLWSYKRHGGPRLKFSRAKAKSLLQRSYHYILSGMMVAIYGQTDKMMLKQMLSDTEVGYYSVAASICTKWVFVLAAIIDSMYPTIIRLYEKNREAFRRKNRQLYAIVFYISGGVAVLTVLFGDLIIRLLYGEEYAASALPLKIIAWYTAFSYLGVARNAWVVCENKQKYLKYMYVGAAVINVGLNFLLIPLMGAAGAALASLVTEICISMALPLLWKDMRPNVKLMQEGICLKGVFGHQMPGD